MFKFLTKKILPPKDPNDFTLTESSTGWRTTDINCPECFAACGHEEYMANVCNNCGYLGWLDRFERTYRQIWNGEKWIYQYKYRYKNNTRNYTELRDTPYKGD
jgi:hypothetical protein